MSDLDACDIALMRAIQSGSRCDGPEEVVARAKAFLEFLESDFRRTSKIGGDVVVEADDL